jgi:hypothetical protein
MTLVFLHIVNPKEHKIPYLLGGYGEAHGFDFGQYFNIWIGWNVCKTFTGIKGFCDGIPYDTALAMNITSATAWRM